jgi:hypothetical protein
MRIRFRTFAIEGRDTFVGKPTMRLPLLPPVLSGSRPSVGEKRGTKAGSSSRRWLTPINCAMRVVGIPTNSDDAPRDFRTLQISSGGKNMVNPEWALSHGGLFP